MRLVIYPPHLVSGSSASSEQSTNMFQVNLLLHGNRALTLPTFHVVIVHSVMVPVQSVKSGGFQENEEFCGSTVKPRGAVS